MNLREDFSFSQSSLSDYQMCQRRFDLRHRQAVQWPALAEEPFLEAERKRIRGEQFHRLVQQHLLGIPAGMLADQITDEEMRGWWVRYLQSGLLALQGQRRVEWSLSAPIGEHWLTAKYDLLVMGADGKALIVDWKTGKVEARDMLEKRLQTLVYRCVLAAAGVVEAAQIEMLYWYVDGAQVRLLYSAEQYERDIGSLRRLMNKISGQSEFPLTPDKARCGRCVYRSYCGRGDRAAKDVLLDDEDETRLVSKSGLVEQVAETEY